MIPRCTSQVLYFITCRYARGRRWRPTSLSSPPAVLSSELCSRRTLIHNLWSSSEGENLTKIIRIYVVWNISHSYKQVIKFVYLAMLWKDSSIYNGHWVTRRKKSSFFYFKACLILIISFIVSATSRKTTIKNNRFLIRKEDYLFSL